jgi:hypothetical protein
MYGVMAWSIYQTFAFSQLINNLHRQPLKLNLFDTEFLTPIARRSLSLSIGIIGAITLSVLLLPAQMLQSVYSFAIYAFLLLFLAATFFLSLRSTHRLIVAAKKRELQIIRQRLAEAYQALKEQEEVRADRVTAWLAYESRIERVPEWPFDLNTIRDLFVSALVPGVTFIARLLIDR